MKRLALLLALLLALGIYPAYNLAQQSDESEPASDETAEAPPAFTLSDQEDDDPQMLRLKAALRLLKSYQVTAKALQTCAATPGAGEALKGFHNRNGNTLAPPVMNVIKNNGGLTPEIKAAMDEEVAADTETLLEAVGCKALIDLVAKSARDLYKAPELAEDYKLVRAKP